MDCAASQINVIPIFFASPPPSPGWMKNINLAIGSASRFSSLFFQTSLQWQPTIKFAFLIQTTKTTFCSRIYFFPWALKYKVNAKPVGQILCNLLFYLHQCTENKKCWINQSIYIINLNKCFGSHCNQRLGEHGAILSHLSSSKPN